MKKIIVILVIIYGCVGYYFFWRWVDLTWLDPTLSCREKRQAKRFLILPAIFWFLAVPISYLELLDKQKQALIAELNLKQKS